MISDIRLVDIPPRARKRDFGVLRIPKFLDADRFQAILRALRKAEADCKFLTKDNESGYSAIGLQYSDRANPIFDAVNSVADIYTNNIGPAVVNSLRRDACFPMFNEISLSFSDVFERLRPLRAFRTRILKADTGYEMPITHIDGRFGVRLHIPLETNSQSWMQVGDEMFHLPADGSAYLLNTSRPHRIGNLGPSMRTHIVIVLSEPSYWGYDESFIERIANYFDRISLDFDWIPIMQDFLKKQTGGNRCSCCSGETLAFSPIIALNKGGDPVQKPVEFFKWVCGPCSHSVAREIPENLATPFDINTEAERQEFISNSLNMRSSGVSQRS